MIMQTFNILLTVIGGNIITAIYYLEKLFYTEVTMRSLYQFGITYYVINC